MSVVTWASPTDDELTALDHLQREGLWTLAGYELRVTNLDKVLFPGVGGGPPVTKRELIRHYVVEGSARWAIG